MKLFIAKEKFASISGYENYEDYYKVAQRRDAKTLTAAKINQNYELIKSKSR